MAKNKSKTEKKKNPIFIKAGVRKAKTRTKCVTSASTTFATKAQIAKADKIYQQIQQSVLSGDKKKDSKKVSRDVMTEPHTTTPPDLDQTTEKMSQLLQTS